MEKTLDERAAETIMRIMDVYLSQVTRMKRINVTNTNEQRVRILRILSFFPKIPMTALGKLLFISSPHLTKIIDSMYYDSLVERNPDESDRRVINISITQKGLEQLKITEKLIRDHIKMRLSGISEEDLETLCVSGENFLNVVSKIQLYKSYSETNTSKNVYVI